MSKMQKESVGWHNNYHMYKLVDGVGQEHYWAESDYVGEGYVTVTGENVDQLKLAIDDINLRMKIFSTLHRKYRKRCK